MPKNSYINKSKSEMKNKKKPKKTRKQLTDFDKGRIVGWSETKSAREIGRLLSRHPQTILNVLNKFKNRGEVARKKYNSAARFQTTLQTDRLIVRTAMGNRKITSKKIKKQLGLTISPRTIQRRLKKTGLSSHFTARKPFISDVNKKKRLCFAKKYLKSPETFWRSVLFSDESGFTMRYNGKVRVWRRTGERYKEECLKWTLKGAHTKKVMVWGCFCAAGVGSLYRVKGILNQHQYKKILVYHMFPSALRLFSESSENQDVCVNNCRESGNNCNCVLGKKKKKKNKKKKPMPKFVFQQDNDPKHTAKTIQRYLENKEQEVLDFPPQSPDLNPIENLWSQLNSSVQERSPKNLDELFGILEKAWKKIPVEKLEKLVLSMPNRLKEVIKNKGGPTSY